MLHLQQPLSAHSSHVNTSHLCIVWPCVCPIVLHVCAPSLHVIFLLPRTISYFAHMVYVRSTRPAHPIHPAFARCTSTHLWDVACVACARPCTRCLALPAIVHSVHLLLHPSPCVRLALLCCSPTRLQAKPRHLAIMIHNGDKPSHMCLSCLFCSDIIFLREIIIHIPLNDTLIKRATTFFTYILSWQNTSDVHQSVNRHLQALTS